MIKRRLVLLITVVMAGLCLHGVKAQELNIMTTLPSLASITEQVGGDLVRVSSITRGVQDAHYVEAKPSYMVRLNKADLLIYSGLELEIGWLPLLIRGARNDRISVGAAGNLNASSAMGESEILEKPRGEVDRSMGDVHPAGNPHYLLNPHNSILVAELIADKLMTLDPDHSDAYEQNLEQYTAVIEETVADLESRAGHLSGKNLICYHVHWSYLLDWLEINTIGYIELRPGIPPTPRHKRSVTKLMQDRDIQVVVISSWKEPTKAREVANAASANLVVLPGEVGAMRQTDGYLEWMEFLVDQLVSAYPEYTH